MLLCVIVQVHSEFKIKILGQNQIYCEDLRLLTLKTKIWHNNVLSRRIGKYSFLKKNIPKSYPELERSIFQIFWKVHCCAKFLFLELATSDLHNKPGFDQEF